MRISIKYILYILYSLMILPTLYAQQGLTRKAYFPGTLRNSASGFSIDKYGYLIGGRSNSGWLNDFWRYNPDSDQWIQKANFPGAARWGAICVTSGSKAYYGLGENHPIGSKGDFWQYDAVSDTWQKLQDMPNGARYWAIAFVIKNKIYVGTGGANSSATPFLNDFWEYNIDSNTWLKKRNFPGPGRMQAVAYSQNQKGYVATGRGAGLNKADFWEYHPESDTWIQLPDIGKNLFYGAFSFVLDSIPHIGLGAFDNNLIYFNAADSTWQLLSDFDKINRENVISFCIGNKVYFGTGEDLNYNNYSDFWSFSPRVLGLPQINQSFLDWKIFPNPSLGKFSIQFNRLRMEEVNTELFNQLGQLVYNKKEIITTGNIEIDLSSSAILPGIYTIKISGGDHSKVERLVIW
jgi:N-acetylneuraminic acid mutarotase